MSQLSNKSADTMLAQAMHRLDETTGAVIPPIQMATTFARNPDYGLRQEYIYSRNGTPNFDDVEQLVASLERGEESLLFSSGLAAVAAIVQSLPPAAHVVAPKGMYYAALVWLNRLAKRGEISLTLFDPSDTQAMGQAIRAGETKLVWIETALNPTWQVMDIKASADLAHAAGAILAVDATVTPPITCQPITHGADIVFHSATKYLNGHSDLLGGVITCAHKDDFWQEICQVRTLSGGVMGPFEAWLLLRGMRTLAVRFERASSSAERIAHHFADHPKLEKVLYPGLKSHPGHTIAAQQCSNGFGGMISLLVKGGFNEALSVTKALHLFLPATSLGGVESLAEHRKTIEGELTDVPANLVRLSVGIEAVEDLIGDIEQALNQLPE